MSNNILDLIMPNRPQVLTEETDYLGTIPKGQMIVDFLEEVSDNAKADIKILGLFGSWGQGKTSLMRWIKSKLNSDKFLPIFFEAWQHEADINIALSLLDVISINNPSVLRKEVRNQLYKSLGAIVKGISRSITVDIIPGVKINADKVWQDLDAYHKQLDDDTTFFEKLYDFKEKFKKLEKEIIGKNSKKKLVVFIDDLDRCEPENVLTLLSAIKLFFTYGENTIFICGIDKDAVNKAVSHKYKDVIKADEYLEKIFDISFNMPKEIYPIRLLESYLIKEKEIGIVEQNKEYKMLRFVSDFFTKIKFGNSRHLKKVLNKYIMIKYFKEQRIGNYDLIPDLNKRFYIILTLFVIILYDFYPNEYSDIRDYNQKLMYYTNHSLDYNRDIYSAVRGHLLDIEKSIKDMISSEQVLLIDLEMVTDTEERKPYLLFQGAFITFFSPRIDKYKVLNEESMYDYFSQFNHGSILSDFCLFLIINMDCVFECDDDYCLSNIFEMAELYL
ncbi:KAP family P-loop domain protein [Sporomusa ovata DSM 2662]|uniref:Phage T7 exclusion protein n=1 Tax=Sporomusa ovata TaxID=2378 RepID=A0A0U1KYI8_9FIRM|nr:KAP family P-loop domain containing protein [Sporomusa ovata]EQB24520.1 KAP family P-loop domain containing protein [Sporomusa ovata DSM 2662]CQR71724.1 Phage T7 exclusion protein [Sporomusa ovata]